MFLLLALSGLVLVGTGLAPSVAQYDSASASQDVAGKANLVVPAIQAQSAVEPIAADPASLAALLIKTENALTAIANKLPDSAATSALRVALADLKSNRQIFSQQVASAVAAGTAADGASAVSFGSAAPTQQDVLTILLREASSLLQRQQALGQDLVAAAKLSDTVPVDLSLVSTQSLMAARQELNQTATRLGIALNVSLPPSTATAAVTLSKYACCLNDADCGVCFGLGDTDADGQVAGPMCGTCQRYGGVGQSYDVAVAEILVGSQTAGRTFHAVLRNNSAAATAPVDIDFFWDNQPLPDASLHHIIVAPEQQFDTAVLRPLALPASAKPGPHRLTAKLSHPKGQDTNAANDTLEKVVEIGL